VRGLYAIVDADFLQDHGVPLLDFAARVLSVRPAILQLRAKNATARETVSWLRALRPPCDAAGTLLFANDRPDLAVLARADGVHVGQDDFPIGEVRRFAPALRIGISTHDDGQLAAALEERPDYVAFGPVFSTTSKARPSPVVGLDALAAVHARARSAAVPLVAIGGIDLPRAPLVSERADMGAVISALLPDEGLAGVTRRASALADALGGAR
jgi:thiamine-phosphate pyrophosphorylase